MSSGLVFKIKKEIAKQKLKLGLIVTIKKLKLGHFINEKTHCTVSISNLSYKLLLVEDARERQ